jgi:hypothetical protein
MTDFDPRVARLLLTMVTNGAIAWLLADAVRRVPAPMRKIQPWMIWFLPFPSFGDLFAIYAFWKVSDSLGAWFASRGDRSEGDCGRLLGVSGAILRVVTQILLYTRPGLAMLIALPALLALLIFLAKIWRLRKRVVAEGEELSGPSTVPQ